MPTQTTSSDRLDVYPPGAFCWAELSTGDLAAAKAFYTALMGWTYVDRELADGSTYAFAMVRGQRVAGLHAALRPTSAWLDYVAVEDVAVAAERVRKAQGRVVIGPLQIAELGSMAIIEGPSGERLALWEAGTHGGSGLYRDPGARCWAELTTNDLRSAAEFYPAVFGWQQVSQPMGPLEYTSFLVDGEPVAGMLAESEDWAALRPRWTLYLTVDDCAAAVSRARDAGAELRSPPTEIPGIGRFATLADPSGAELAVIAMA